MSGLEDYFPWNSLYEKKVDPLILTTYEENWIFSLAVIDNKGIEVRSKPLELEVAIKEVRRVVNVLEERNYRFALKDVPDDWLEGKS
ncbi:MAG: hypothetical protein ABH840_04320 [Nanoarchaeota archaeon]